MGKAVDTGEGASRGKGDPPSRHTRLSQQSLEGESIDKVRDILFGAQVRDFERRFSALEKHLRNEVSDLSSAMSKRFDSLESYLEEEFESHRSTLSALLVDMAMSLNQGTGVELEAEKEQDAKGE